MSLFSVITQIIKLAEREGYTTEEKAEQWIRTIKSEAIKGMMPLETVKNTLDRTYKAIFERALKSQKFTIAMVEPRLRQELNRRIAASANLIKLNRQEAVEKTLRRFSGWLTSVPEGGGDIKDKVELKKGIVKSLKDLPYADKRVIIDQGHKLNATLNNIVAEGSGAIAVIWHSHWRQAGYDYREDHKERDDKVYLLKNSWADKNGLVKGEYYNQSDGFAVAPFCRCYGQYLYHLSDIPSEMLTKKGKENA